MGECNDVHAEAWPHAWHTGSGQVMCMLMHGPMHADSGQKMGAA